MNLTCHQCDGRDPECPECDGTGEVCSHCGDPAAFCCGECYLDLSDWEPELAGTPDDEPEAPR